MPSSSATTSNAGASPASRASRSSDGAVRILLPIQHQMPRLAFLAAITALLVFGAAAGAEEAADESALADRFYRSWLDEVAFLITEDELTAFQALRSIAEREAFIDGFWKARDPDPASPQNEVRERFSHLSQELRAHYAEAQDERLAVSLVAGPAQIQHYLGCAAFRPTIVWRLDAGSDPGGAEAGGQAKPLYVVFREVCRDTACEVKTWRLWSPAEGLASLLRQQPWGDNLDLAITKARHHCRGTDAVWNDVRAALSTALGREELHRRFAPDRRPDAEWWSQLPPTEPSLEAQLGLGYPGRHAGKTVLAGQVEIPRSEILDHLTADERTASLTLEGHVLKGDRTRDRFRVRYHLPLRATSGETVRLDFRRHLGAGSYGLVLRLLDNLGDRHWLALRSIEVPAVAGLEEIASSALEGARVELYPSATTIEIAPIPRGFQVGSLRVDATVTGEAPAAVVFLLDGERAGAAAEPPYSAEIVLGSEPRTFRLEAVAVSSSGQILARDLVPINAGPHRFAVRLLEPAGPIGLAPTVRVRAAVDLPEGAGLDRLELYRNDDLAATLYQPPFIQTLPVPEDQTVAFVRAVAYLDDGTSTEDATLVRGAKDSDEIEVGLIELFTTVVDRRGNLVEGLTEADFEVYEEGRRQEIARFERVEDLPLHLLVLLDVSSSMERRLGQARESALAFFEQVVRPGDKVGLMSFRHQPQLVSGFTEDVAALGLAARSMRAWGGTALHDSVILSLYHFGGLPGSRALVVLSDGEDQHSRFDFDDVLGFARRAGIPTYTISLPGSLETRQLRRLARETGGRFFRVSRIEQLTEVYEQLERELRSQYLLTFQPPTDADPGFREISIRLDRPGLTARSRRGYYRD